MLLVGILSAAFFTCLLNAGTLGPLIRGESGRAQMGTSVDERYYFALIRDGATGYSNLGNVSLKEHRFDTGAASYAPLLQGSLMRLFHWDIAMTVLFGYIAGPFLFVLLLFFVLLSLLRSPVAAAASALTIAASVGSLSLLRSISPQITITVFVLSLAVYVVRERTPLHFLQRGLLIGVLFFFHIIYAGFLLLIEGVDFLLALLRGTSLPCAVRRAVLVAVPALLAALLKFSLGSLTQDMVASADTYRRMGMIPSHMPAAPGLQITIVATVIALVLLRRYRSDMRTEIDLLMVLLTAGLLALNQSLLHGIDVVFGLYYALPIHILLSISWTFIVWDLLRCMPRVRMVVLSGVSMVTLSSLLVAVNAWTMQSRSEYALLQASGIPAVLDQLQRLPRERVILAPYAIADLVPVFTDHYVAFNHYSRYQVARDEELADRYLLQESLFPSPPGTEDHTYNLVFGLYAGNLAARERTACRVFSLFRMSDAQCRRDIRSKIYHQDLLTKLDRKKIDSVHLLRTFHVDILVTPSAALSAPFAQLCSKTQEVGGFFIHECQAS